MFCPVTNVIRSATGEEVMSFKHGQFSVQSGHGTIVPIPTLERYLKFDGQVHQKSFPQAVQDFARKTLIWEMRWALDLFSEDPALSGGVPWFQGYGAGMARVVPAWDQERDAWPDITHCNLNAYEQTVAEICW